MPETLLQRAYRLRCPRCGEGRLFSGWFQMNERCDACRLHYERAPGYFLGSTYFNYGATAITVTILYLVLHFGLKIDNKTLALPLSAFVMIFPLFYFRIARALWLAMDCYFDPSMMDRNAERGDAR